MWDKIHERHYIKNVDTNYRGNKRNQEVYQELIIYDDGKWFYFLGTLNYNVGLPYLLKRVNIMVLMNVQDAINGMKIYSTNLDSIINVNYNKCW